MPNQLGDILNRVLPRGLTDSETDEIIAAVNAPKADQTQQQDTLLELRALNTVLGQYLASGNSYATMANHQRIGVCLRRQEISPALKCR
ncbi:MAG: hypothetical protein ACAI38_08825 [Myxococcota bacterium]